MLDFRSTTCIVPPPESPLGALLESALWPDTVSQALPVKYFTVAIYISVQQWAHPLLFIHTRLSENNLNWVQSLQCNTPCGHLQPLHDVAQCDETCRSCQVTSTLSLKCFSVKCFSPSFPVSTSSIRDRLLFPEINEITCLPSHSLSSQDPIWSSHFGQASWCQRGHSQFLLALACYYPTQSPLPLPTLFAFSTEPVHCFRHLALFLSW